MKWDNKSDIEVLKTKDDTFNINDFKICDDSKVYLITATNENVNHNDYYVKTDEIIQKCYESCD